MSNETLLAAGGNFGSPIQLLILLVIILLLFGGNRLRSLGGDLGAAIKGFKNSMTPEDEKNKDTDKSKDDLAKIIDSSVDSSVDSEKVVHTEKEKDHHKS